MYVYTHTHTHTHMHSFIFVYIYMYIYIYMKTGFDKKWLVANKDKPWKKYGTAGKVCAVIHYTHILTHTNSDTNTHAHKCIHTLYLQPWSEYDFADKVCAVIPCIRILIHTDTHRPKRRLTLYA